MDKKSKIVTFLFLAITLISVFITFYQYIILENITFYTDEDAFQASFEE